MTYKRSITLEVTVYDQIEDLPFERWGDPCLYTLHRRADGADYLMKGLRNYDRIGFVFIAPGGVSHDLVDLPKLVCGHGFSKRHHPCDEWESVPLELGNG